MIRILFSAVILLTTALPARAQPHEINRVADEALLAALAAETSGETAHRTLQEVTLYHRMRGSGQFRDAAEAILARLQSYGFDTAEILSFPADGETMYGTQRSRPGWEVDEAWLWELEERDGEWVRTRRLADRQADPITIAQDSATGGATAWLVNVGAGTDPADYEGKDIAGNYVLTSSQPGAVEALAVGRYGAAGIVSWAQNQRTAWWSENDRLVRWGHLSSFPDHPTHAFMVSPKTAEGFINRLGAGERIRLEGHVEGGRFASSYDIATATIPGADPALRGEEIAFTCHLDHQRPGANDNASGCVAILEAARTLKTLIDADLIPAPKRTIRFIWPPEIEGSLALLNGRPDIAARLKTVIHMDMVGGGPETKAVFRIAGVPWSLPHFTLDLAHAIGRFVNDQTLAHASGGNPAYPLVAPTGGREAQLALFERLSLGSDHQVYSSSSWSVPAIYLHDWPDRYIHTNFDTVDRVDPTKLKRAAFQGALAAHILATLDRGDIPGMLALMKHGMLDRAATLQARMELVDPQDASAMAAIHRDYERRAILSLADFAGAAEEAVAEGIAFLNVLEDTAPAPEPAYADTGEYDTVYARNPDIKGTMSAFGYSYLADKGAGIDPAMLRLGAHPNLWGESGGYTYEALNLVNGQRSVREIRDWLMAEFGPVPVQAVADYLAALAGIGVIRPVN